MILVTGATGRIGGHLVRALVAAGAGVRALVRTPDRAARIDPACEIAHGDLDEPESLRAAFAGVERVFLLSKEGSRQLVHERNAVHAAREAGVAHLVKLSAWGAGRPNVSLSVVRRHAEAEALVARSGLAYTLLRPNYFMQNLAAHLHQIQAGHLRASMGDGRISMIDVRDIAAAAARILLEDGHAQQAYELSGPAALSFVDVAEALSHALQRPIIYQDVALGDMRRELLALNLPEAKVADILDVYEAYRGGLGAAVTDDVERLTGHAPRTIDHFLEAWPARAAA
jgi:uncharacterized protein YbjT (DUF2867 family)